MSLLDVVANDPKFTDSRKASLYSNFQRLKETNEYGFNANLSAWEGVFSTAVLNNCFENKTTLDTTNLISSLTDSKNGAPVALNVVIDDMVTKRQLIPLSTWLSSSRPLLGQEWSLRAAMSGIGNWAWSKVFSSGYSSGSPGKLKPMQYVSLEAVKKHANDLLRSLQQQSKHNGGTVTSKVFNSQDIDLTSEDIRICITYLNRELQKDICFDSDNELVILAPKISEEFQTIGDIHRQMAVLSARTDKIQVKVEQLEEQAKAAVKAKQTPVAKQRLRSKQEAEKTLAKTLSLFSQLETVLNNVDIASDQATAIDVLEKSSRLIKSVNSTVGSTDKVSKLIDDISDNVAETEEISNELARISLEGNDAEIEKELEELERQQMSQKMSDLPKVPSKISGQQQNLANAPENAAASASAANHKAIAE